MKLTTLELLGFKSFLNRTTFRFDEGVTCIVGPNGCGKSNIVDAITWVLGERGTKSLRVKEMGDVIFHGSSVKKQVNMAEVTLGLLNEEKEYAVKRRIYRDGTNEYYINGEVVRLKDVQDFFLGTGIGLHSYAIIEQGNIDYFTQMKPHERRVVVEEASGITRFEEKKRDALFRMEEVKANLERVDDVSREVVKNYGKAVEESGRLAAYTALKESLRQCDVAILADGLARIGKRCARLAEREETFLKELETQEEQGQGLREKIRSKEEEVGLIDSVARQVEIDIKGKEKDMEAALLELNYLEEEKKRVTRTASDLRREIEALDQKVAFNGGEILGLSKAVGEERASLAQAEERASLMEAKRNEEKTVRESLEKEVEEQRNRLFGAMTRITEIKNSITERERMLSERGAREARRVEEARLLSDRMGLLEEKIASRGAVLKDALAEKVRLEKEEKDFTDRIDGLSREAGRLHSAIDGLKGVRRGKEEIARQMKSYTDGRKRTPSPYRQLIDILKPSKETEHVMEKFFSRETEYHALTDPDPYNLSIIAKEYADNFVFFPQKGMFSLNGQEADLRVTRVESLPEAFRRIEEGEEGLFLSGNVLVDSRGFILKGQDRGAISISRFREKMKLESELAQIEEELAAKASKLSEMAAAQRDLEKTRQQVRERKRAKEQAVAAMEREIIQDEAEKRTTGERLKERARGPETVVGDDDRAVPEEAAKEKERWEAEKGRIEGVLFGLKQRLEGVKGRLTSLDEEFHRASITIERARSDLRKKEEEAVRRTSAVGALEKEKAARTLKAAEEDRDLERASLKAEGLESAYGRLKEECEKAVARYEEMKGRLGDAHAEGTAIREAMAVLTEEHEKTRAKKEAVERERLVLTEKEEVLRKKLREDYGVERPEEGSWPAADESERARIVEEINAVGEINFRAEKERVELKERREFLEKQKDDLLLAMESLKKTITKIDSVSHELFLETFERVNEAFEEFTQTLFKGGQGRLILNAETNGIDLYVQPPGKKVIRMELLSGGEKALISLSFLLSLMQTRTSPFTLMDEIDAPLDDANLVSLLHIVRTISRKTQVILITHNRITMESSNTVYGITMEDAGISKTISIRL